MINPMLASIHAALIAHSCFQGDSPAPVVHPRAIVLPQYHDGQFTYPEVRVVLHTDDIVNVFVGGVLVNQHEVAATADIVQSAVTF